MGRFRIPADVAAKLVSDFRRRRLIGVVASVLLGSAVAFVFLWPRDQVDLERCRELYASARTSADSAAVDTLALTLQDKRDPERGGKEPVRCAVVRESRVSGLTAVGDRWPR